MTRSRAITYLFACTIFLSAFLLFQVQPIIAKMILPWFGGSSAVWSTCMLFFQVALLAGYLYAHWLHGVRSGTRQAAIHTALLLVSLAALPILPDASWKPTDGANPIFRILGLLAVTIGMPYFMLSTTSPLLQAWFARRSGAAPYRLFALSNLASMLALVSYPVFIEPSLTTRIQGQIWSGSYVAFAVACAAIGWLASRAPALAVATEEADGAEPGWGVRAQWLALAACASTLLLAVTNFLTQDVAAIPFLWVLPLSVYLLTFIICFDSPRLYHRGVFMPLVVAALACFAWFLWPRAIRIHVMPTIALCAASLFVCCMVCHGELVRLKPPARGLTAFYVMVSLGGAAGGLFVGLIAPFVFNGYYEFPIALAGCAALAAFIAMRRERVWVRAALATGLAAYFSVLGLAAWNSVHGYLAVARNFYGQLRVLDEDPEYEDAVRKLLHGRINHGMQMKDEQYRRTPVAYFCAASGVGHAMRTRPPGTPWRVGILGLGCGALAAYGQPGDMFRIYEINPLVLDLAQADFTYLKDTPAKVEVALGDGRLTLERETGQQFDLLVMDAFSGDSVPVHLITRNAFETYFRHLKRGGILALNISNRYLDLKPVMERAASQFGKIAISYDYVPADDDFLCVGSSWVLLLDRGATIPPTLKDGRVLAPYPRFRAWTDDFSNMYGILK